MADDKRRKRWDRIERVRRHPVRQEILALYAEDEKRSLDAADLQRDLDRHMTSAAVAYHVRELEAVDLLPQRKRR